MTFSLKVISLLRRNFSKMFQTLGHQEKCAHVLLVCEEEEVQLESFRFAYCFTQLLQNKKEINSNV